MPYDAFGGVSVVVRAEPLPEGGPQLGGARAAPVAGGEDVDQFFLAAGDRARREGAQVEVGPAGGLVRVPVLGVHDDRPVQVGVVEHQRRVVGDQRVRGEAEGLDARVAADVDDPLGAGPGERAAVPVVRAGQDDEAGAEAAQDALQVERGLLGAAVVAVGRGVQDRDRALGDAQQGPHPGHVVRSRRLEDVVARVAVLQRGVTAGVDALPGQCGVAVGGQDVVPLVDAPEQFPEVHVPGGRRVFLQVEAHVLERGAVLGLDEDLTGALLQPAVEVDVVDQVLGTGQRRPVGGRARAQPERARRERLLVLGAGDPRRAHLRGVLAERGLQRARVAAVAAAPVGTEDGAVGAQREAKLDAVVQLQHRRLQGPGELDGELERAAAHGHGQLQGPVGAVQPQADQAVPEPGAQRDGAPRGAVTAVVGPGRAQELGAGAARQPAPLSEDRREVVDHAAEQHRAPARQFGVPVDEREDAVVLLEDVEVLAAGGGEDAAPALPVVDAHPVEGGDRLRGHQHRVRPGRVLVVAGRELEALLLDELAPADLVPGDHQHPQQPRAVHEPERRGTLLAQLGGELVAGRLAVPVRACVVEDQDVRLTGLLDPVGDRAQRVRGERVVAVQEEQVVARRLGGAGVAGAAQSSVLGQVDGLHAHVAGRVLVDDRAAAVRRAVVHGDQFEIGVRLREHRIQALGQVRLDHVRGDNDTEPGQGTSMGRSARAFCPGTADGVTWLRFVRHVGDARRTPRDGPVKARPSKDVLSVAT